MIIYTEQIPGIHYYYNILIHVRLRTTVVVVIAVPDSDEIRLFFFFIIIRPKIFYPKIMLSKHGFMRDSFET